MFSLFPTWLMAAGGESSPHAPLAPLMLVSCELGRGGGGGGGDVFLKSQAAASCSRWESCECNINPDAGTWRHMDTSSGPHHPAPAVAAVQTHHC